MTHSTCRSAAPILALTMLAAALGLCATSPAQARSPLPPAAAMALAPAAQSTAPVVALPVAAGSAASDFAPRPSATPAQAARSRTCTDCRRATSSSDVALFWLLFGGVAKAPEGDEPAAPAH